LLGNIDFYKVLEPITNVGRSKGTKKVRKPETKAPKQGRPRREKSEPPTISQKVSGKSRLIPTPISTSSGHVQKYWVDVNKNLKSKINTIRGADKGKEGLRDASSSGINNIVKQASKDFIGQANIPKIVDSLRPIQGNYFRRSIKEEPDVETFSKSWAYKPGSSYSKEVFSPTGRRSGVTSKQVHDKVTNKTKAQKHVYRYEHTLDTGESVKESALEVFKRHNAGGATDQEVEAYAALTLNMAKDLGWGMPDAIIVPPKTLTPEAKERGESSSQKDSQSLHIRVAKTLSERVHMAVDKKTGKHYDGLEGPQKIVSGEADHRQIAFDPDLLDPKDAKVQNIAGWAHKDDVIPWSKDKAEKFESNMRQRSSRYRVPAAENMFRQVMGVGGVDKAGKQKFDRGSPEERAALKDQRDMMEIQLGLDEKQGLKSAWILNHNLDTGSTLFAMSKIMEEMGIKTEIIGLFDMKNSTNNLKSESTEALSGKIAQGKGQAQARKQGKVESKEGTDIWITQDYFRNVEKRNLQRDALKKQKELQQKAAQRAVKKIEPRVQRKVASIDSGGGGGGMTAAQRQKLQRKLQFQEDKRRRGF